MLGALSPSTSFRGLDKTRRITVAYMYRRISITSSVRLDVIRIRGLGAAKFPAGLDGHVHCRKATEL